MMSLPRLTVAALMLSASALTAQAETTLKWASRADIFSLDPVSIASTSNLAFLNHIYEGLVRYNKTFGIEPALATEWELVDGPDGGKAWRFTLRQGVTFHDGAAFTADDVVASFRRNADPDSPLRGNMPLFKDVRKIDDHTVEVDVSSGSALFLNDITNIFMFDEDWLKDNDALKPTNYGSGTEGFATTHAMGTGPFMLESRKPDAMTVLVANPGWWDEKHHNIDRLEFIPIASAATRVAALLSGEVDLIDSAPLQDLGRLEASPDVTVHALTELRTVFVGFNRRATLPDGRDNPFNDIRVRQAFELAIDRDMLNQRVMRGQARPTGSLVAPDIGGYVAELDVYEPADPERARAVAGGRPGRTGLHLYLQQRRKHQRGRLVSGHRQHADAGGLQPVDRHGAALDPVAQADARRDRCLQHQLGDRADAGCVLADRAGAGDARGHFRGVELWRLVGAGTGQVRPRLW